MKTEYEQWQDERAGKRPFPIVKFLAAGFVCVAITWVLLNL